MKKWISNKWILGFIATLIGSLIAAIAVSSQPEAKERFFITRKSHLYDAGVTLQEPHVRALNTGGRV